MRNRLGAIVRITPLAVAFLLMCSCQTSVPPDVLIRLQGAENVKSYSIEGMDVLEYQLDERYPAESRIAEVTKHLKEKGWKPLEYSWLSPAYKSSHSEGWTIFKDPPNYPTWIVYEWQGDWQDTQENIVTYTFRYQEPVEKLSHKMFVLKPGNTALHVTALYLPAEEAKQRQSQVNPGQTAKEPGRKK